MRRTIFKIQRPIATNVVNFTWLFYTKGRTTQFEIPDELVSPLVKAAMGEAYKIYADMSIIKGKTGPVVTSFQKVEDQDW